MLPLLLALNLGLAVETSTPDALCPPLQLVKDAVAERLGTVELSEPWTLHYESVHREAGDYVRMELRDAAGAVPLRREFPSYGESCTTLAQVMAVVVERYFRSFQSEDKAESSPAPLAEARTKSPSLPPVPAEGAGEARAIHALELGGALTSQGALGPFGRYVWAPPPDWRWFGFLAIEFGWAPWAREQAVFDGRAQLSRAQLGISMGPSGHWGSTVGWRAGPLLAAELDHVVTHGLAVPSQGTRLVPGAGIAAALTVRASAHVGAVVGASALLMGSFATPEFQVDGREVFAVPIGLITANVGLRLAF